MRTARALALVLSFAPACAGDDLPGEDPQAVCDMALSYDSDVAPIIDGYCSACHSADVPLAKRHGAPGDRDFDSEADVLAHAQRIMQRAGIGPAAENRSMPPRGYRAPSDDERTILASFLACHVESAPPGAAHHHH